MTDEAQRRILGPLFRHQFPITAGLEGQARLDLCAIPDVKPGPGQTLQEALVGKQRASAASATLLLGLSGSGKTRALTQAASSSWSLFLEAGEPGGQVIYRGHADVLAWLSMVQEELPQSGDKAAQSPYERQMRNRWHCLIAARCLGLVHLLGLRRVQSAAGWTSLQLQNAAWLGAVYKWLLLQVDLSHDDPSLGGLRVQGIPSLAAKMLGQARLVVIIDEAQALVRGSPVARTAREILASARKKNPSQQRTPEAEEKKEEEKGERGAQDAAKKNGGSPSRPPLTLALAAMLHESDCLPVLAGTQLRIAGSRYCVDSFVMKDEPAPPLHDFPWFDPNDVRSLLEFHLNLEGVPEADLELWCHTLQGSHAQHV